MYEVFLQSTARKQLKKLKREKVRLEAIEKVIQVLRQDPRSDDSVELLDPDFYGLRRMKTEVDRIVYQVCEDCRGNAAIQLLRKCIDCDDIPEKGIKIFDIPVRRDAYKKR